MDRPISTNPLWILMANVAYYPDFSANQAIQACDWEANH